MRVSMVVAVLWLASPSHAGPVIGTTMTYGESLGGEAGERVAANLYMVGFLGGGWTLGGEMSGSIEGYTGGYGCGTTMSGGVDVPAVAVTCFQPGVGTHLLVGTQASPSSWSQLRLELGVGATAVYLMPGDGGRTHRDIYASGLIRVMYLGHLGSAATGDWWVGVALEERALGIEDTRVVRSFGLVLEGRAR